MRRRHQDRFLGAAELEGDINCRRIDLLDRHLLLKFLETLNHRLHTIYAREKILEKVLARCVGGT